MFYITGDTHGEYDEFLNRIYQYPISEDDIVIVCGDFGFLGDDFDHRRSLRELTKEKFTIIFVDGNHENFDLLYSYPIVEWNGGKAHKIAENIYHLMRGQLFTIKGKTFFTMGGAYSRDKDMRVEGISWWSQELPNDDEYEIASKTLEECNYKVDYVLTHTPPKSAIHYIGKIPETGDAELTGYLDWVRENLEYKMWFAGHFHVNRLAMQNIQILLDEIVVLK